MEQFLRGLGASFPKFAAQFGDGSTFHLEQVKRPATNEELEAIERKLETPLPESYKSLLRCARGFWLFDGMVQFDSQHPFFHHFEPLDQLTPLQQKMVKQKGGQWPPPSQGMLCFAECFMEADGDQVLFDVSKGLMKGEYPVMYYAHEASPANVRVLAKDFTAFMDEFLDYPAFSLDDGD
jgi:hypothetical protein